MNKNIKIINGNNKVILSAPHSVLHMRENSIRPRETRTSDIVRKISTKKHVYGIYKLKNEYNDANWDEKCEYKENLKELVKKENIKFLLDIHGMADYREQDICIGINEGQNILDKYALLDYMIEAFNTYGFKNVSIDVPFKAHNPNCVSTYIASNCHIPTFQIEINLKYRSIKYKEFKYYNNLLNAISDIIDYIIKDINKNN